MSEERPRLYISVDRLAVLTIDENGGTMAQRSLWLAMEDLAFKNAKKYPGKSFVISQDKLGEKAKMHFSSVKRISKHFEGLGLLSIKKRRKKGSCRYDVHFYTLHYPKQPIDHSDLRSHRSCNNLDIQLCEASKCPAADAASPLALRHFDASHQKDIDEAMAAKREASAKYKAEQLAAAEERKRQEEAELAERKERLKLAAEKGKADEEAARLAEDARRLAMRADVGSCVAEIRQAVFDEYDPGTLPGVLADYDRSTFYAAVGKLLPDMSDKLRACIKRNEWMFD